MKLALCYPAYRNVVNAGHLFLLTKLIEAAEEGNRQAREKGEEGKSNSIAIAAVDSCFLDLSRCRAISGAISGGAEWALCMDSDTFTMDVGAVVNMLNEGVSAKAAVIAAPVELRGQPNGKRCWNAQIGTRYLEPEELHGRVVEVERIGTAFMAVNCDWIRKHWPWNYEDPWFQSRFINHESGHPMKMSEDFEFCDKVRARGGKVLADGRVPTIHANITSETEVIELFTSAGLEMRRFG